MDLAESTPLIFSMPKFTKEFTLDVITPLSEMGLGIAFDAQHADFSNLASSPLYIDTALQKTKLEITEHGTKAAAASMLSMQESAVIQAEEAEPRKLILDSPYLYFIVDPGTTSPLFMGIMNMP